MSEEKYIVDDKYQVKLTIDDAQPGVFKWEVSIMRLEGRKMFTQDFYSGQPFSAREECAEMARYVAQNWIDRNP